VISPELAKRLKGGGLDLDRLRRCLAGHCSGGPSRCCGGCGCGHPANPKPGPQPPR
jgi:hypothetical protein